MIMSTITKDTEAILLLCCRLPKDLAGDASVRPLTHTEYIKFAAWLHNNGLRPSDLFAEDLKIKLMGIEEIGFDFDRFSKLMARGVSLSFARERWERSGIWILSRADADYPKRWKTVLKNRAPALLFGAGNHALLNMGGLGVVGSRNISDDVEQFVIELSQKAAANNINIVSGGARGVDSMAMQAATQSNGRSLGILADSLMKAIVKRDNRIGIENGCLTLVTPYSPEAGFNAGNAMGRNKLIYASSDYVVVAQADKGKGGTWAGATECLNNHWAPVLVQSQYPSEGLNALISKGAHPMDIPNNDCFTEYLNSFEGKVGSNPTQESFI